MINYLANPRRFLNFFKFWEPIFGVFSLLLIICGLYYSLIGSPADYQQGDTVRIMYVHVPSAWLASILYFSLAISSAVYLIWKHPLADVCSRSIAPVGLFFAVLTLITGSLWGKPMWGTYWQWADARLMSELMLLFLFLGYMVLRASFDDRDKADRISAILAVVGVINIPIIHYSVEWWSTLHQGPTIAKLDEPSITMDMLIPLLIMIIGFTAFFGWLLCKRLQGEILKRERQTRWVDGLIKGRTA